MNTKEKKELHDKLFNQFKEAFFEAVAHPLSYRVIVNTDIPCEGSTTWDPETRDFIDDTVYFMIDRSNGEENGLYRDGWQISENNGYLFCHDGMSEREVIDWMKEAIYSLYDKIPHVATLHTDDNQQMAAVKELDDIAETRPEYYHITGSYVDIY